ncbi:DEAD/DEAH box helicase [Ferruginibacter albus]|uniref:DEAD/DEAH box helicase n=1 Tax=Ferruginibacter albus TaxID=2875540 RepID=UPI001CC69DB1|nr:DEAD/DEAH box helicase [Ferruginibacter albus]UAY53206.1 DEAD/DEAH box helicase [Ferruginibacter albus]
MKKHKNLETLNDIEAFLNKVLDDPKRANLQSRAVAWSSMRNNGKLNDDAPAALIHEIETDLAEHGFSLLRASLACKELGGNSEIFRIGFERAGNCFEALTSNSGNEFIEGDFYRIIAACCYHIASYSAIAYSILNHPDINNLTAIEKALRLLILRDIKNLKLFLETYLSESGVNDERLAEAFQSEETEQDVLISLVINDSGCRALAYFEFALQTGNNNLFERAKEILAGAIKLATSSNNISHYWVLRLISNLIDDLWLSSLHKNLPVNFPIAEENKYEELRELFLATLYNRNNAEVELWPSQLESAKRAQDLTDDLVVALPTSAGKTRIAEITSLMTLSVGRRILIVTPLRALSAQTERSFRATFGPLGFRVSSLYGPSGSGGDEDALRTNDIIISTPEKLDFALRSDPTIIDDVGLVVLDEGHLIGPQEREIRFEILVQKLLKRADSKDRRIVCLSAILPPGKPLEDLTSWIRKDKAGTPIFFKWRPTRQRFGTISFLSTHAKLNFSKDDSEGFVSRFIEKVPKEGNIKLRSGNIKDITLASAWKFAQEGKRVLVFVTQANWVEPFGQASLELVEKGFLPSLVPNLADIKRALQIGEEWLGANHPAVLALKIGVGIHHGKLPSPFLRELEILLAKGKILVTVASPTLSQGLNINAAILLVPYLTRAGEIISGEEFANVAGRAGRAFVDVEGLVLHVMKDQLQTRKNQWFKLVSAARHRNLQSGILQVVHNILIELSKKGILKQDDAFEYLANNIDAWKGQLPEQTEVSELSPTIEHDLEMLDAMVFGLIESLDADSSDLPTLLNTALTSSLWERQIANKNSKIIELHRNILKARANLIWRNTTPSSRKGHFAMGVGLEAGLKIDGLAEELVGNLDEADEAAFNGDLERLVQSIINIAQLILNIAPFKSDEGLVIGWEKLLRSWLSGASIEDIGPDNMKFIEDVFVYKLVWAIESLRVRRISIGWEPEYYSGMAASCVETGTFRYQVALLIRSGLPSRICAMAAVQGHDSTFSDNKELREWLKSDYVEMLTDTDLWPTQETSDIWKKFREDFLRKEQGKLIKNDYTLKSQSFPNVTAGLYRFEQNEEGICEIKTPDFHSMGKLHRKIQKGNLGIAHIKFFRRSNFHPIISRIGIGNITWEK